LKSIEKGEEMHPLILAIIAAVITFLAIVVVEKIIKGKTDPE